MLLMISKNTCSRRRARFWRGASDQKKLDMSILYVQRNFVMDPEGLEKLPEGHEGGRVLAT